MDDSAHEDAGTRRVARGGLANLIGAAYSGIAAFVITTVITRISSSADAGIYFSAVSIMLIAIALTQIGTPVGYVYLIARYRSLGSTDRLRSVLMAGGIPMLILASVIITGSLVFRDKLGALLFGEEIAQAGTIVAIIAGVLVIAIIGESALAATRGLGTMRPTVVVDKFINPTVQLLALLVLAAAGWTGSKDLIATRVVGFIAVAVIAVPWLVKHLSRYQAPPEETFRERWTPSGQPMREFWSFTGPRALGQIAQVGIQRIDVVLVALWLSPSEAAIYAAATRFLVFGQLAARSINLAVQPQITTLAARAAWTPLQNLYRTATAWGMWATWPLYLVFIIHADSLLLVFGPEYNAGATVLRCLSVAMMLSTACGAVDAVLVMAGRSDLSMINAWIALSVNLGLNVWLIPKLGILGAAIAWTATIIAKNVVPLFQVWYTLQIHPIGRITWLAAIVPLVIFGLIPWAVDALGGGIVGGSITLALGALCYSGLLWRWRQPLGLNGILARSPRREA